MTAAAITVAGLFAYPVKSLRGHPLSRSSVEPLGLAGDRRWLVIDDARHFVTQRTHPQMATVSVEAFEGGLVLSAPGHRPRAVDVPDTDAEILEVAIWRDRVPARLSDASAGAWLGAVLGMSCRLVHLHDPLARATDPAFAPAGSTVGFADAFPILLASMSSLADLNRRLDVPVGIDRFRANVVVEGAPAWDEDGWRSLRIGAVAMRVVKPCSRCIMTTVDQQTGQRPDRTEPLRTLARFRGRASGEVLFGMNLVPAEPGCIAVGDEVRVS